MEDYDLKLRIAKENYEQRLLALTGKVARIFQEIQEDEVIATMKADPITSEFASLRVKEICEGSLHSEREETISRQIEEIAELKSSLELASKDSKSSLSAIERTEELLNIQNSNGCLKERIYQLYKELKLKLESFKACQGDFAELVQEKENAINALEVDIRAEKRANEKLAYEHSSILCNLSEANSKNNALSEELECIKGELQRSRQDCDTEKIKNNEFLSLERQKNDDLLAIEKRKNNELFVLNQELQKKLDDKTRQNDEENQIKIEEIKNLEDKLQESVLFVQHLQKEIEERNELIDQSKDNYERTLEIVQSDMQTVKDMWSARCEEIQEESVNKMSSMAQTHQAQVSSLKQTIHKLEHNSQKTEIMHKDKIEEVRQEYNRQIKDLYIQFSSEKLQLEEKNASETTNKLKEIRSDHSQEIEFFENKIRKLEEKHLEISSGKRETDSNLELANAKIDSLNARIHSLKEELNQFEEKNKKLSREKDEMSDSLSKLRGTTQEQDIEISRLKADIQNLQRENKDAIDNHSLVSHKFNNQIKEYDAQLNEKESSIHKLEKHKINLEAECERYEKILKEREDSNALKIKDLEYKLKKAHEQIQEEENNHSDSKSLMNGLNSKLKEDLENTSKDLKEVQENFDNLKREMKKKESDNKHKISKLTQENYSKLQKILTKVRSLKKEKLYEFCQEKTHEFDRAFFTEKNKILSTLRINQSKTNSYKDKLEDNIQEIKSELSAKDLEINKKSQKINDQHHTLTELKTAYKTLENANEELNSTKEDLIRTTDSLLQTRDDLLNTKKNLENSLKELSNNIAELSSKNHELSFKNTDLENELRKHIINASELTHKLNVSEEDKKTSEKENRSLKETMEKQSEEFKNTLKKEKLRSKEELFSVTSKLEDVENKYNITVCTLNKKLNEIQEIHRNEIESVSSSYSAKVQSLEYSLQISNQKTKEVHFLKDELKKLELKTNDVLGNMENDLIDLQTCIENDKEIHLKMNSTKNVELKNFQQESIVLRSQVDNMRMIIDKIETEKDSLKRETRILKENIGARQIDELKTRLNEYPLRPYNK